MKWAFIPFAKRCGIKQRRTIVRFAEQSWMLLYPGEPLVLSSLAQGYQTTDLTTPVQ